MFCSRKICSNTGILFITFLLVACFTELVFAQPTLPPQAWTVNTQFRVYSHPSFETRMGSNLATSFPTGLSPAQVRRAYNLPAVGGNGTIAIIDAFDCPTVQNDFVVFSQQFGLPSSNLEVFKMPGVSSRVDEGWALEALLDVQWSHAIAPNATILLVEAKSDSLRDLLSAVSYAVNRLDVVAVSMSWGASEFSGQSTFNSYFTSSHGVVFFASSGDNGAGVIWPSTSANVVAVGGTTLVLNPDGTFGSETAWSGSGGGLSGFELEPEYQIAYNISGTNGKRAVPDVAYNANPAFGFSVFDSTGYKGESGWFQVGGTSAGSPQWAAIHCLGLSASNGNFYRDAKWNSSTYFRDVVSGSNGAYSALPGYDYVTGLGSPITYNFGSLNVSISTDRPRYPKWSNVAISVAVKDAITGIPRQGASVDVAVYDIHGRIVWIGTGNTNSAGIVQLTYKLIFDAQMGNYRVAASVSMRGYQQVIVQTLFFSFG